MENNEKNIKKVLIYANFSFKSGPYGGGATKAINFYEYLKDHLGTGYCVDFFNIEEWKRKPFSVLFGLKKAIKKHDFVLIFPQGIKHLSLLLTFLKPFKRRRDIKILYPVVGGWLGKELKNRKRVLEKTKIVDCFFCETKGLCQQLIELGVNNVIWSPVFTLRKGLSEERATQIVDEILLSGDVRFCTFSRVSKSKGIDIAIEATKKVIEKTGNRNIYLDIYGKIDPEFYDEMMSLIGNNENIKYKGIINDRDVINTISTYYCCLFPTHYEGEGFPATVLECLMSGLPVIASNWKYNKEFVIPKENGLLFSPINSEQLSSSMMWAIDNKTIFINMRKNCIVSSTQFTPEVAMKCVIEKIKSI
jgi:glycosyltransferase involved in cell wall biosynthesis